MNLAGSMKYQKCLPVYLSYLSMLVSPNFFLLTQFSKFGPNQFLNLCKLPNSGRNMVSF